MPVLIVNPPGNWATTYQCQINSYTYSEGNVRFSKIWILTAKTFCDKELVGGGSVINGAYPF